MSKTPSRFFAAVAAAGLMASLSACQVKPGDYRIYKITNLPAVETPDCPGDPDLRDSTTFFGTSTFAIFATDPDSFFLEVDVGLGPVLLTGERSGSDYTFSGDSVDVMDINADMATMTSTVAVDVAVTIKGYQIDGTSVVSTAAICNGDCAGVENQSCTRTTNFFGTEVKDVELERPI